MSNNKICFFGRSSLHYRQNIFMLMDQELPCDFFFGDYRPGKIKYLDVSLLKNFKGYFHNINFGPFYWQKGGLKLLKSDYTDIITSADTYCLSFWLLLFNAKRSGKRIWLWAHGAYGNEGIIKRFIIKKRISKSAGVFLYGQYAKDILVKWGVDESKLHLIYNSLNYDEQVKLRSRVSQSAIYSTHFHNNNFNLVFIGRLMKIKKLYMILDAMELLKEKGENYNVTFVGDGEMKQELMDISCKKGLKENVWFYGACYDEVLISDFIYNADVCVSPGNVGLTAMHALSFGTPVITHNNYCKQMPEFEAIEDGITGAFFEEDDVQSLSNTISRWLKGVKDRDAVREACYKVIDEKYNPYIQVDTFKNNINKINN